MDYPIIHQDEVLIYFDNIAVQQDRTNSVKYDEHYFEKYVNYEGTPTAILLNKTRTNVTEKYCKKSILDIGIGSGDFIKSSKLKVYGFDINPCGIKWLKFHKLYVDPYCSVPDDIEGWTFWDSLEHFPEPQKILKAIKPSNYVFIAMPMFIDILKVRESKHYRPDEHYYYFTPFGMIKYMIDSGFKFIEHNDAETKAGRQDILTFVFQRS